MLAPTLVSDHHVECFFDVEVSQVRSRVEVFEQIRRDARCEGLSIRELAVRHQVHRRTVRQALASAIPAQRKGYPSRPRPAIDPWA
jgi:predicted DNA-binding protein (UPF0251 family)